MRVFGLYFDLLFVFLFFLWKEWDNKETKGDANTKYWMDVKLNEYLLRTTTTQQMSLFGTGSLCRYQELNLFLFQEKIHLKKRG